MGPNTVSCEFVRLFVPCNIYAIYYKVNLNYCNHRVSRSFVMGVATLPENSVIRQSTKRPRRERSAAPPPNPGEVGEER